MHTLTPTRMQALTRTHFLKTLAHVMTSDPHCFTPRTVHQCRPKPFFFVLAHALPDDHSASDGSKQNTLGIVLKITHLYLTPDLGKGLEWIE